MARQLLLTSDPHAIQKAVDILKNGGLVAFPTDTVYGLAADLGQAGAIQRLYEVKGRDAGKAIAVLIGNLEQLERVAAGMTEPASRLAAHYWPGALTLVLPRRADLPENLSSLPTIGVRMPDHPFALALLRASGPLAVTSANRSGEASAQTAAEVLEQLGEQVELVLDGGRCPGGVPSTVVDCAGAEIRVLREGAISTDQLLKY